MRWTVATCVAQVPSAVAMTSVQASRLTAGKLVSVTNSGEGPVGDRSPIAPVDAETRKRLPGRRHFDAWSHALQ